MDRLIVGRGFGALIVLAILAVAEAATLAVREFGLAGAMAEGGFVERLEDVLLLGAAAVFAFAAIGFRAAPRMAAVFASVLCLLFLFREFDPPVTGPITAFYASHAFRWLEIAVTAAIVIPYLVARRHLIPELVRHVVRVDAWPFLVAFALLVVGDLAEKLHKSGGDGGWGEFFEELFELKGFAVLLLIAALYAIRSRQTPP